MGKLWLIFILVFLFAVLASCTGKPLSEMSEEFRDGYRSGQKYSKQDAMALSCHFLRQNSTAHMEIQKHIVEYTKEGKPEDFISGFYRGYESHFKEYVDIYCDKSNN